MSGGIFQPLDSMEDLDNTERNPLLCYLCNQQYEQPCLLTCYHSFCSHCLRGRASNGNMLCPLCGGSTALLDGANLPQEDVLLKFLVESSIEEKIQCANCDELHTKMFFCNTCSQPLCATCRDETHKAKMFMKHEIVTLSRRTKDIHKSCAQHHEPYIMFSTEKKTMQCINCFRDTDTEDRAHCVDLDTAYNQGCQKLDQSVQSIRELQNSVRDGIIHLRALLEEIKQNSEQEKTAITLLCTAMLERITQKKESLLANVDSQFQEKEAIFKDQLLQLNSLLPTLQLHLVSSMAFSNSANKLEFLSLGYMLMDRLSDIAKGHPPLQPTQNSQINTDFKTEFAKCLEGLLYLRNYARELPGSPSRCSSKCSNGATPLRLDISSRSSSPKTSQVSSPLPYTNGRRNFGLNGHKVVFLDVNGAFAEFCKEFDQEHREVLQNYETLKTSVQDLQRDMTQRRCLTKQTRVSDILKRCVEVEDEITKHLDVVDKKREILEKHWEETCTRVAQEQEIYQAQFNELLRIKEEQQHMTAITKKLAPFVKSIAEVTERIAPKLGDLCHIADQEDQMHQLLEQINTMTPDSQQRVEAIEAAQEVRQTASATKTNPLDDELIKTKGLLKAPPSRRELLQKAKEGKIKLHKDFKDIKELNEYMDYLAETERPVSPGSQGSSPDKDRENSKEVSSKKDAKKDCCKGSQTSGGVMKLSSESKGSECAKNVSFYDDSQSEIHDSKTCKTENKSGSQSPECDTDKDKNVAKDIVKTKTASSKCEITKTDDDVDDDVDNEEDEEEEKSHDSKCKQHGAKKEEGSGKSKKKVDANKRRRRSQKLKELMQQELKKSVKLEDGDLEEKG